MNVRQVQLLTEFKGGVAGYYRFTLEGKNKEMFEMRVTQRYPRSGMERALLKLSIEFMRANKEELKEITELPLSDKAFLMLAKNLFVSWFGRVTHKIKRRSELPIIQVLEWAANEATDMEHFIILYSLRLLPDSIQGRKGHAWKYAPWGTDKPSKGNFTKRVHRLRLKLKEMIH